MMRRLTTVAKTGRRMKNSKTPISAACAGRHDLHATALAHLLVACGDHDLAGGEAAPYLGLARPALPELDLGLHRAPVVHPLDDPVIPLGEDRRLGPQHRGLPPPHPTTTPRA